MTSLDKFQNRFDAGHKLAKLLIKYKNTSTIVLGIPRGGVVTAAVIAKELSLALGLLIVRKIGHPSNPEYAIAAISESGRIIQNPDEIDSVNRDWLQSAAKQELKEAIRRRKKYWGGRPLFDLKNKTIILVDDGLATGLTMETSLRELSNKKVGKIVVAIPVCPKDAATKLESQVDELVTLLIPDYFAGSVGAYYLDFPQTTDEEVIELINQNALSD